MEFGLLAPLDAPDRQRVLKAARRRKFTRDAVVFWAGDPGDSIHLIASGHVAVQINTMRGDVATLRVLGPGEHFGELALVSPGPRSATMRALSPLETLVIGFDDFAVLRQDPAIEQVFVTALATEIRRLAGSLTDALYLTSSDHLWKRLAAVDGVLGGDADAIDLPLTQSMLATLAGVTRQTVNKFLEEAEALGIVRRDARGKVTIVDRDALQDRASNR
jgi:CRP/FNR family cyclic AMP-dependent transcriptional regulator